MHKFPEEKHKCPNQLLKKFPLGTKGIKLINMHMKSKVFQNNKRIYSFL